MNPLPSLANRSLLEEEFASPYEAWKKNPGLTTSAGVLKAVEPVIQSALRTYSSQGAPSPTMRSRAKIIVLNALPKYDPSRAKLRTHLMVHLQSLRRATAEANQIVHTPERVRLDQHRLRLASEELADRLGREPSDAELSQHVGLSPRRMARIRLARQGVAEGTASSAPGEPNEVAGMPAVAKGPADDDTWLRFIYHDLDPRDQVIMEHTLGLHGRPVLPKIEIAKRLGVSPGAVSQRAARIQQLIDSREELAANLF